MKQLSQQIAAFNNVSWLSTVCPTHDYRTDSIYLFVKSIPLEKTKSDSNDRKTIQILQYSVWSVFRRESQHQLAPYSYTFHSYSAYNSYHSLTIVHPKIDSRAGIVWNWIKILSWIGRHYWSMLCSNVWGIMMQQRTWHDLSNESVHMHDTSSHSGECRTRWWPVHGAKLLQLL